MKPTTGSQCTSRHQAAARVGMPGYGATARKAVAARILVVTTLAAALACVLAAVLPTSPLAHASGRIDTPRIAPSRHPLTLLFVLDRSGSMTGALMDATRRASAKAVGRLRPSDRVGLIAFDQRAQLLLELRPKGNGRDALGAIKRIQPGGGTAYGPALALAKATLGKEPRSPGARRHILFLSDGQSSRQGVLDQVRALSRAGVTLSTVALGLSADKGFLGQMANAAGGRSYAVVDVGELDTVLVKELRMLGR